MGFLITVIFSPPLVFYGFEFIFLQKIISAVLFPFFYLGMGYLIAPYYKKQIVYVLLILLFIVTCIGLKNQIHTLPIIERIISLISGVICSFIYSRNKKIT